MLGRHRRREKRRCGEGRSGASLCPPNDRRPNPRRSPTFPKLRHALACPAAISPYPLHASHPLPYPHAHPHAPDRNRHFPRSQENLDASRLRQPLQPNAAGCGCRACPGEGRGIALPCFPLSVCGDPPTMPSPHLRRRGPHIRLVPLFQPFQHPPAGPSAPSSGPCLADTPCFPLSTCPSRLKPNLRRVTPGTGRRKIAHTPFSSIQTQPSAPEPSFPRQERLAACGCRACPAAVTPATLRNTLQA